MHPDALAQLIVGTITSSIQPLRLSQAALDATVTSVVVRLAALETVSADLTALRERVAVLETRAPVPGPPGAPGRDGLDGRDGADGFGLEDFSAEYDGERTITLAFARQGRDPQRYPLTLPFQKYQGTYQAGRTYVAGDTVTAAGALWHCAAPTTAARPGDGVSGWQLAVKRGADGRDLRGAP